MNTVKKFLTLLIMSAFLNLNVQAQYAGDLDATFGSNGKVSTSISNDDDGATSMVIQPDGKIIVAGFTGTGNSIDFALVRYNPDGSLDASFGIGGKTTASFDNPSPDKDIVYALGLQADGKIVAVGATEGLLKGGIARFNSDGSLDNMFGIGGYTSVGYSTYHFSAKGVKILGNGKILITGTYEADSGWEGYLFVLKLNADGSPDVSFNATTGVKLCFIGNTGNGNSFYPIAEAMEVQPDGKMVIVGSAMYIGNSRFLLIARIGTDGVLDPNFASGGFVGYDLTSSGDDIGYSVAIQPDGKIVVAGTLDKGNPSSDFIVLRSNGDGTIDNTFSGDGMVTTDFGGSIDAAKGVVIQPDGKIVVVGYATINGNYKFGLVRYNVNGTLDNSFGVDGKVTTDISAGEDVANCVALQTDGKLFVAGESYTINTSKDFAIARYLTTPNVKIEEAQNQISFAVYPNPLKEETILEFQTNENANISVFITDLQGKVLEKLGDNTSYSQGNHQIRFETADFASGIYILHVESQNGIQYFKLIK